MITYLIIWEQIQGVLEWLLNTYFGWVGNWGVAIILVTVTVRLCIFPLTIKQLRSAAGMQAVAPKIKQIQNKYKGKTTREDNQAKQAEIMALYKEHGINPFASCLPLVFQIPVFIGLNSVLRYHIHPTSGKSFLFINDIFVEMQQLPHGQELLMTGLYLISMLGSTLLFSFITDKQQRYLFAGMSVVFAFFIKGFTVGLVIYWITTNLWTIGQQGLIKKTMGNRFPHLQTQPKTEGGGGLGGLGGMFARNPKPTSGSGGGGSRTPKGTKPAPKAKPKPTPKGSGATKKRGGKQ
jgi:YidC/Oxa1 family membrane protein insertase